MRRTSILLLLTGLLVIGVNAQSDQLRIIMIGAHPDDCDLDGGGTAILLAKAGHAVKFVSVTNGDAGHQDQGGGALAKRRAAEAKEAGKRFGVEYDVLDNHDGELEPTLQVRLQVIRKIREWNADVVIAPRPNDYHPDHRYTGILVQDAAYMVAVPNVAPDTPPLTKNPYCFYFKDGFDRPNPFRPDVAVDITAVIKQKVHALDAHVSQFYEWLPWIGGYYDKVPTQVKDREPWLLSLAPKITPEVRKSLEKWYGAQPDEKMIKKIFPMLGAGN